MSNKFKSNIPNLLVLIKPKHFGYNQETASSNLFQKKEDHENLQTKVSEEFDGVIEKLSAYSIRLKVFEDGDEVLPDVVFSNNWISSLPDGLVTLFPMFAENRRKEIRLDIANWIMDQTNSSRIIDLSSKVKDGLFLEGTGSMIFDHFNRKAYACESERTNISLFEAYCNQIGYLPLSFESVDLNGHQIYHTNVMMTIAEKYCLINLDSIHNQMERSFCKVSLEKSGKEVISLSYMQMNSFAANALEVLSETGKSHLVMSQTGYDSLTTKQIQQIENYSEIIMVNVSTIEKVGGGSIRCMLTGIFT